MRISARTQSQLTFWFLLLSTTAFTLFALSVAVLCLQFPFELEVRESTVWLHVLAREAGVNIYDGSKVAFINMVYGPIEAIVKGFLHFVLPFLDSYQVTRFFVPLLPASLVLAAWGWRKGLMDALLVTAPLYLFFVVTDPMAMVIGRPDPTAFFLTNLVLFFTAPRIVERWQGRKNIWLVIVSVLASLVFHTSWRFFPLVAFYIGGALISYTIPRRGSLNKNALGHAAFVGTALFLVISFALKLYEFGWNFGEYYRRFFGIFRDDSGWGVFPTKAFQMMPNELLNACQIFIAGAAVASLLTFWVNRDKKREVTFWVGAIALVWLVHAYSYYANGVGGGVRYFFPGILVTWTAGLTFFPAVEARVTQWRLYFCVLVWTGLPWAQLGDLNDRLWREAPRAGQFLGALRRLPRRDLWSDCYHFFKTTYEGDVIDTPDIAFKVARTGFFGPAFTKTVDDHFASLKTQPPRFLLWGFIDPAVVGKLTESKGYRKVGEAPDHNLGNGFVNPAILFERKEN